MTVRTRGSSQSEPKGTAVWRFGGNTLSIGGTYPIVRSSDHVEDTVHAPDNGPFYVYKFDRRGGHINGHAPDGTDWSNYLADGYSNPGDFGHHPPANSPDNLAAATMGAARTNPSRPSVDVPAELFQLGDTVRLLKTTGSGLGATWKDNLSKNSSFSAANPNLLGFAGRSNLAWRFGIAPLYQDVLKLLKFKDIVNQRIKELKRLHASGGLKRTVTVYNGSNQSDLADWLVQSNFGYFVVPSKWTTTEEVRVHCRWFPAATFFPFDADDGDLVSQARRAVLGTSLSNWDTYWEALPWSWLIDWASTCGSFLRATRNVLPASLSSVSVMRHTRTEFWMGRSNVNGGASCDPCSVIIDSKLRSLSTVFPSATLNFLSGEQMGIVSSLSVRRL